VVKPAPFTYHLAHDVAETVSLLAELGEDAKILAGGQSLVPMMNLRLARPSALIDVTRIPGLDYLRTGPDGLHIGALTRHRAVELSRDPGLLAGFGVLPSSAHWIGHYPIRARGTFGGSIAHGDASAEWCLLAVLLGAEIVLAGPRGERRVAADRFFEGFFTTAAEPDEMITEVWFPRPARHAALTEFAPRQGDFAIVAAAVSLDLGGEPAGPGARPAGQPQPGQAQPQPGEGQAEDGQAQAEDGQGAGGPVGTGECRSVRIVLGGVGPAPVALDTADLAGQPASADTWREAGRLAAAQIDPIEEPAYRKHLTATLVARALAEAASR
jgi:carbon-monoxide dehydrogenase medium subunit